MNNYKSFVRNKTTEIQSFESSLRSLSYILPGRFQDSELASEAVFTFCNLFSALNTSILCSDKDHYLISDQPPSDHNKYTTHLLRKSDAVFATGAFCLAVLRHSEILIEMLARKLRGDVGRWRIVGLIETIKCAIKLYLFQASGHRMLLSSTILEPEMGLPRATAPVIKHGETIWKGKRTGIERPFASAIESKGIEYLVSRAIKEMSPEEMVRPLTGIAFFKKSHDAGWQKYTEYIFILRPLLYIMMLRRYGLKSWKPWLISIGLELASLSSARPLHGDAHSRTSLEKEEIKRRQRMLFYYLLKSPFYDSFTKSVVDSVCETMGKIPLISIFSCNSCFDSHPVAIVKDYQPLWENYHFYVNCNL